MHIQISLQDGMPIYRQIVTQIKYLIASRQLLAEEELPPIRTLAKQLKVTPNTIVKAYGELESEGLIYKRRGAGTFVSGDASPFTLKERRRIVTERVDALLAETIQLDMDFDELQTIISKRFDLLTKKTDSPDSSPNSGK